MKFKVGDIICFFSKSERGKNYTIKQIYIDPQTFKSNYVFENGRDFSLGTDYADKYYMLVINPNNILKDML